jgi:hypothetical protein
MTEPFTTEPLNTKILDIDARFTPLLSELTEVAQAIEPIAVCTLKEESKIKELTFPGLYFIEAPTEGFQGNVQNWIRDLRAEWEQPDFRKSHTPDFKEKRINKHPVLKAWMPMYLGKSKNVSKRVIEHVNLEMIQSTFAMKLRARNNPRFLDWRLSVVQLEVTNYAFIAENLERLLRDRLSPLIGKQ